MRDNLGRDIVGFRRKRLPVDLHCAAVYKTTGVGNALRGPCIDKNLGEIHFALVVRGQNVGASAGKPCSLNFKSKSASAAWAAASS